VDLNRLILDLVPMLRDDAMRQNISVRLGLGERLPKVDVDPIQIQQLLLNLTLNAMDAMAGVSGARELVLRTDSSDAGRIRTTVEDRGPGISSEAAARIFEPFFTTKPHGMGMGLAICRSIVESHDGRIWAEPAEPNGTAFRFTLPEGA
jgi:signal transduction histidine kinase